MLLRYIARDEGVLQEGGSTGTDLRVAFQHGSNECDALLAKVGGQWAHTAESDRPLDLPLVAPIEGQMPCSDE